MRRHPAVPDALAGRYPRRDRTLPGDERHSRPTRSSPGAPDLDRVLRAGTACQREEDELAAQHLREWRRAAHGQPAAPPGREGRLPAKRSVPTPAEHRTPHFDRAAHLSLDVGGTQPYDPTQPIDLSVSPVSFLNSKRVTPQQQAFAENLVAVTVVRLPQWSDPAVAALVGGLPA